jgi:hypothetical protein
MTPVEQASSFYGPHFCEVVADHLLTGYVFSTPDCFLLGKRKEDAWFVTYLAGDLAAAVPFIPFPLPYLIFQRDNGELRRYSAESLTRRIYGKQTKRAKRPTEEGRKAATGVVAEAASGFPRAD